MADSAYMSGTASILNGVIMYPLLSDLRDAPVYDKAVALVIGKSILGDGLGGFYLFQVSSTAAEDTKFLNVITSNITTVGRWIRVFQKAQVIGSLPYYLVNNGGVRNLYCPATTDSSGQCIIYATNDGTSTGTALFTEIWQITPEQNPMSAPANPPILGYGVASTDLKTITCSFSQNNSTTLGATLLAILGSVIKGLAPVPAGVTVLVKIEGV